MAARYSFIVVGVLLSACTSVEVTKYTGHEEGIHFSLPATFLLVTPQADGTVGYKWLHLPDKAQEYVIQQNSVLSKFTLDIKVTDGLLASAGVNQDSSVIPAKAVADAGTLANAWVQAASAASSKSGGKSGGANEVAGIANTSAFPAPGPVLLRVSLEDDTVHLRPVTFYINGRGAAGYQPNLLANSVIQKKEAGGGADKSPVKLTCDTDPAGKQATLKTSSIVFAAQGPGLAVVENGGRNISLPLANVTHLPAGSENPTSTVFTLKIDPPLSKGDHKVTIPYSPSRGSGAGEDQSTQTTCTVK